MKIKKKIVVAALLVLAVGVTGVYFVLYHQSSEEMSRTVWSAWTGDYDAAILQARNIADEGSGSRYYFSARALEQSLSITRARSPEDLAAIVPAILEDYETTEELPSVRAYAVNRLMYAINSSPGLSLFDTIFSRGPVQEFLEPGSRRFTLLNLAEHSASLSPNSEALFQIGVFHAQEIFNNLGRKNEESARVRLEEEADGIISIVQRAEEVFETLERPKIATSAFGISVEPWFYYWKGYLLGAVSLVRSEHVPVAKDALNKSIELYETRRDVNDKPYVLSAPPAAYAQLAYVRYALQLGDQWGSRESLPERLTWLVETISSNRTTHTLLLSYLMPENVRTEAARARYVRMAWLSPEFKELLISLGWKASDF